jgi:outer membrane protein TolC
VALAEQFAEQGLILDADVLKARVYLSEMDDFLEQARNGAQLAEAALNFEMGADQQIPPHPGAAAAADPSTGGLQDWIEAALEDRHDLAAARLSSRPGASRTRRPGSGYLPEVAVVGNYGLYDDTIFGATAARAAVMAVARINLFGGLADIDARDAPPSTTSAAGEADRGASRRGSARGPPGLAGPGHRPRAAATANASSQPPARRSGSARAASSRASTG